MIQKNQKKMIQKYLIRLVIIACLIEDYLVENHLKFLNQKHQVKQDKFKNESIYNLIII